MPGYKPSGKPNPSEILPGVFLKRGKKWVATVGEVNPLLNGLFNIH